MGLYKFVLLVHVLSAILGLGPGFIMIYVVTRATNMTELRHAYLIRNRLHIFVMVGGSLLLLSGLLMGLMHPYLWQMKWYVLSLVLFLVALAFGPLVLSPRSKPIKALINDHHREDIPVEYYLLSKKLFLYER
ncbi:MAG TPA: DUF2269 family protein, partial [Saprospiraceae bacterium]|nr:DUF2269 family protein [Saprospiraceae bacterium]